MEALLGFYNESNKPIEVSFNINKINLCYIIKPMEFKYAIGDFYPIPVYHHEHIKTELKKIYTTLPKEGHCGVITIPRISSGFMEHSPELLTEFNCKKTLRFSK